MRTYDIIVAIHQARKMGDKTKFGPDCLDQFGAAADVSGLSTRSEGPTPADRLPDDWGVGYTVRNRRAAKTKLSDGIEPREYKAGNVALDGPHSTTHKTSDGMGNTVYYYTRGARLLDPGGDHSTTVDRVTHSDVILLVPGIDGKRHEVKARALAVSDLYGDRAPDNWTWSR